MRGSAATIPWRVWRPRRGSPCTQYWVSETGIVTPSWARANFDGMSGMSPRFILIASCAVARATLVGMDETPRAIGFAAFEVTLATLTAAPGIAFANATVSLSDQVSMA